MTRPIAIAVAPNGARKTHADHPALPLTPDELAALIGTPEAPWIVDVRKPQALEVSERMVAGALWRDHKSAADWADELPPGPLVGKATKMLLEVKRKEGELPREELEARLDQWYSSVKDAG